MLSIQPIKEKQTDAALSFVEPYEDECVNLCAELLSGARNCYVLTETQAESDEKILGVFAFRNKRTVFHCLPFAKYKSSQDKRICSESQSAFLGFFADKKPFCINGEAAGGIFLRNILKNKKNPMRPSCTNEYFLMTSGNEKTGASEAAFADKPSDIKFFAARTADYEHLLPLELGYQREEVIPKNFEISDEALAAAFRDDLLKDEIYALEKNGAAIAKAKITSRGRRYSMIGGVYTIPSERKNGYAKRLLKLIMDSEKKNGNRNFCLYAKKKNPAAVALYTSLGFEKRGDYLLIYY